MPCFVDYHCHLLPAVDDGAADVRESLAMARILADFGFAAVHCTPHLIEGCFENDPERVVRATGHLQELLDGHGIGLRLIPGTEHYLDEHLVGRVAGAITVAGRHLLVEAPFACGEGLVTAMASGLMERGLVPLFAHPERCGVFDPPTAPDPSRGLFSLRRGRGEPDMERALAKRLIDAGCRFQGNLGSFAGIYGGEVRQRALLFLRHGIYSCVGSDAHRSRHLESALTSGMEAMVAEVGPDSARKLLCGAGLSASGD